MLKFVFHKEREHITFNNNLYPRQIEKFWACCPHPAYAPYIGRDCKCWSYITSTISYNTKVQEKPLYKHMEDTGQILVQDKQENIHNLLV